MKTILFSAAALSFTGAALANGGEWSALDREVETLASSLVDNHEGIAFSGYADIYYNNESDADTADFGVNNARIMASGGSGGFGANIEYNLATSALLDAYITQDLGGMTLGAGRHKVVGNASSMQHERDMFFQTRSNIGYHFVNRDEGITLSGGDGFNWSIGIADGDDTGADTSDYRMSAHADMNFGGGIAAGITYTSTDNGAGAEGDSLIIDLSYTMDALSISFEMAEVNDSGGFTTDGTVFDGSDADWAVPTNTSTFDADSSPMSIAVTYNLGGESSIGLRIQDNDDAAETEAMDVAYNYGMYGIQYSSWESTTTDSDRILIGLQVGF
jgi:hypothetical protein